MKAIIFKEVERYRTSFNESQEGLIKNWPDNFDIYAWLISMKSGGVLKPHMHENSWISGSIYINVPPKVEPDAGNLVVCMDNNTRDMGEHRSRSIDVVTGSMCLFPSSLFHYTIPFESNEDRIVMAFDIVPE